MKALIRPFYLAISKLLLYIIFIYTKKTAKKQVCVLDIDNTIADTWRARNKGANEPIKRLDGSYDYLATRFFNENYTVIYLSHRPYTDFFKTYRWLKENGFPVSFSKLFLVQKPVDKLPFLEQLIAKHDVTYFDDLSYGRDNGEIQFYSTLIDNVRRLPLHYHDFFFIEQLNVIENK